MGIVSITIIWRTCKRHVHSAMPSLLDQKPEATMTGAAGLVLHVFLKDVPRGDAMSAAFGKLRTSIWQLPSSAGHLLNWCLRTGKSARVTGEGGKLSKEGAKIPQVN